MQGSRRACVSFVFMINTDWWNYTGSSLLYASIVSVVQKSPVVLVSTCMAYILRSQKEGRGEIGLGR